MGFFDRLLGREDQPPVPQAPRQSAPQQPARSDDEIAVERYQYLLRTAPPDTIEQVHTEAFGKLTEEQRQLLFEKLSENANPSERPTDAAPSSLAKAATRAEIQQPGTLQRTFGDQGGAQRGMGGPSFGSMVGSSILGTVAGYVIASALVSAFMPPMDGGADAAGDAGDSGDASADAGADGGGDAGGDYSGGGDGGGGDFGGGADFGGDFGF